MASLYRSIDSITSDSSGGSSGASSFARAVEAHRISQGGHVRAKLVLIP